MTAGRFDGQVGAPVWQVVEGGQPHRRRLLRRERRVLKLERRRRVRFLHLPRHGWRDEIERRAAPRVVADVVRRREDAVLHRDHAHAVPDAGMRP